MADSIRTIETVQTTSVSVEGFEDVFVQDSPEVESSSVQEQTLIEISSVEDSPLNLANPITVDEAAKLLHISANAVCKRLRKGTLKGQKIPGKFKDEWLVEGAGLIEVVVGEEDSPEEEHGQSRPVHDQQPLKNGLVQDGSEKSMSRLLDLIEKQAARLESAAGQIGYLQAQIAEREQDIVERDSQIKLLTDSQHKKGWLARFCAWFVGQQQ